MSKNSVNVPLEKWSSPPPLFWHSLDEPIVHLVACHAFGSAAVPTAVVRPPGTGSPGPTTTGKTTPAPEALAPFTVAPFAVKESVKLVLAVPEVSPVASTLKFDIQELGRLNSWKTPPASSAVTVT